MADDKSNGLSEPLSEPQPDPVRGPSIVLSEARQKLGLSQKEVADKLFLTTNFIQYIDDGEFDRFPKPAFVKGYLRSYARVVELSGDLMVELYEKELQAAEPTMEMKGVTDEQVGTASITGPVLQTGVIGLVVLVIVIAFIWWLVSDSDKPVPRVTQTVEEPPVYEAAPDAFEFVRSEEDDNAAQSQFAADESESLDTSADESVQNAAVPEGPGDADVLERAESVENAVISTDVTDEETGEDELSVDSSADGSGIPESDEQDLAQNVSASGDDAVKIQRNSDGERNYIAVDAGGFDQMDLTFNDECWVEITDGQQGLVYNDLNRSGDVLTVYASLPIKVLLGKATEVEMIYNGRPFNLEPHIGPDNTAKLTIAE